MRVPGCEELLLMPGHHSASLFPHAHSRVRVRVDLPFKQFREERRDVYGPYRPALPAVGAENPCHLI
jgi:hypothetical protein